MRPARPQANEAVPRARGRYLLVLAIVAGTLVTGVWLALAQDTPEADPAREAGTVRLVTDDGVIQEASVPRLEGLAPPRYERWLESVPSRLRERRGLGRVTLETDREALAAAVDDVLAAGGGTVRVPARAIAAESRLPIVQQALRNNCETAALSMLLAGKGVRIDQLELQEQLPSSGPADPEPSPLTEASTWGDPDEGFVGRADGGGTSGGYGIYQGPIAALAERHGVELDDLSEKPPAAIYNRLLEGRPVMVWVGLSDGPYQTWRTPDGGEVTGNFGEHTVVLTGIQGDDISVNDPLVGERTTWTRAYFEELWARLGRRALGV